MNEVELNRIGPSTLLSGLTMDELCWRYNSHIHQLYTCQDFARCLELIELVLRQSKGHCEFALFMKGKIRRQLGFVNESLELFQAAAALDSTNIDILKEIGRSLYLLGRFETALQLYDQIEALHPIEQWDLVHQKGLCLWRLRRLPDALQCFTLANQIHRHDSTFDMIGRVHIEMGQRAAAAAVYLEALEMSPDSAEILTTLGLLHLKMDETFKAFDFLGNALTHNSDDRRTILAAASVIQDHNDIEVALVKYRIAAVQMPTSAPLWNNIGLCFYARNKLVAAISCLKKALYLDPFQWMIAYNLGLAYLKTRQFASAYHYFSSSINLKQDQASSYMYLAVTLYHLNDVDNTRAAFQRAVQLDGTNLVIRLNHAIILNKIGDGAQAASVYREFKQQWNGLDETRRNQNSSLLIPMAKLDTKFGP